MGRLKNSRRYYVRKAGTQIPAHVQRLLKMLHPTVDILWEARARQWAIVQTIGGISQLVRCLGPGVMPTLANTVYYLNSIHPARLVSESAKARFLESLDSNPLADAARKSAQDAVREGSSDLYDRLTNRRVIPIRG